MVYSGLYYRRPGGVDVYKRPDGVSEYSQPSNFAVLAATEGGPDIALINGTVTASSVAPEVTFTALNTTLHIIGNTTTPPAFTALNTTLDIIADN